MCFGIRQNRAIKPMFPDRIQEINIAVFGRLWDHLHVNPVLLKMPDRVATIGMSQAPGMAELTIADVVQGHGLGMAGIEPVGGLIDNANVALGRVGVGDQELQFGVVLERPKHYA